MKLYAAITTDRRYIIVIFILILAIGMAVVLTLPTQAQADTRYVKVGGTGDGTSWATASGTLQAMIDAVELAGGGTVCVASGTYTPTKLFEPGTPRSGAFQMRNNAGIYGGFPNTGSPTWVDRDWEMFKTILSGEIGNTGTKADNCYHVFYHPGSLNLDSSAVLDGCIITSGNADGSYPYSRGGGMYNNQSSPTLNNCIFTKNSSSFLGGGICNVANSSPSLTNCIFSRNIATYGAGVYIDNHSSSTMKNCIFSGNSADNGGGIFYHGDDLTITNCHFSGNTAIRGGGMHSSGGDNIEVTNCYFSDNSAISGGGMFNRFSSPDITNCIYSGNLADAGGGIFNRDSSPDITNCTLTGNTAVFRGSGLCYEEDYLRSMTRLSNCIIWGNTSGTLAKTANEVFFVDTNPTISHSNIRVNPGSPVYGGAGNISGTPMFVDPDNDDFHLLPESPCINAGANSTSNLPDHDFEGTPRILHGTVDMGAYEYGFCNPDELFAYTLPASNVGTSTITLNGLLYQTGTSSEITAHFEYGTQPGSYPYSVEAEESPMDETGSFRKSLAGLNGGQTYYYRTKVTGAGTSYGLPESFTLLSTLEVFPSEGLICSPVVITGYNYAQMPDQITIYGIPFEDTTIVADDIDGDGLEDDFRVLVMIPRELQGGVYTVNAGSGDTTYIVSGKTVTVTPSAGPIGTTLRINGTGWCPRDNVNNIYGKARLLYGNGPEGVDFITDIQVNDQGRFEATGQIPNDFTADLHGLVVYFDPDGEFPDSDGDGIHSQGMVTVAAAPPTITIVPESGHPGDRVIVYGEGFQPESQVQEIVIGGAPIAPWYELPRTDSTGSFELAGTVPGIRVGMHTLEVRVTQPIGQAITYPFAVSNPWGYDIDRDRDISKQEVLVAMADFFAGLITKQQALEVIVLFFNTKAGLVDEFSLAVGQEALVEDLVITFVDINGDSRCPIDATCVWQGEASVEIMIQDGQTVHSMALTYLGLTEDYAIERYDGYQLAFKVYPQPETGKQITLDQYRLIMRVTKETS